MEFLELPPSLWPFGDNLPVLRNLFEKTKQVSPFPAFKENCIFRKGMRNDLVVFDPAKIAAIKVAVGDLEFSAIASLSCNRMRTGDLFMSNYLSEEFSSTLKLGKHELVGPEITQGIGRNNH